ncbi:hypothetical protein IT084_09765 [Desulfallas sp. Bu1-1]|uniref:TasA family protein n=1 Tax=Desulfallas sp. Bu1-1 TaxID=2787620 RepID=UPI00189ED9E7|nr:TasA family protein [Desulfallas sp. Bu1-1]MBF7083260.1 hypothetical protein [Desulfallas sp. Bu1-1]
MKKRLMLSLMTVALVALLASGATFALFTADTSNVDNTFTAGTVTLDEPATTLIDINNIAPGDSGSFTYEVAYTGNLEAWLGLDTVLNGDLASGATPLDVTISDGTNNYSSNASDQVLGRFSQDDTVSLDIDWSLPLEADNDYQGASAQLSLSVKAVQAKNNINAAGTGPSSW